MAKKLTEDQKTIRRLERDFAKVGDFIIILQTDLMETPDRFGHVRAKEHAKVLNAREAGERFLVVRVVPPVGITVRFHAFGRDRVGRVVDHKVDRLHVSVQIAWRNKRGGRHLRWYPAINLHAAGTLPDAFSQKVA